MFSTIPSCLIHLDIDHFTVHINGPHVNLVKENVLLSMYIGLIIVIIADPDGMYHSVAFHRSFNCLSMYPFNPFKPNRISHFDQSDQSIFILRDVRWYFIFLIQILIEHSVSKQWRT